MRNLSSVIRCLFLADSCTHIKSIGKPVTHNARYVTQGTWMKDPLAIMGAETIFVMENYYANVLEEFENMDKFKAGTLVRSTNCLITGTGQEEWCMDLTFTTTGNFVLVVICIHSI